MTKRFLQVPELIVGFDTETTGLDVTTERAISYGFCAYRYGQPEKDEHFYVVPDRPISEGARRVHGLSMEDIEAKRATDTVYSLEAGLTHAVEVMQYYQGLGAFFVGSNVTRFDLEMLRWSYQSAFSKRLEDDGLKFSRMRIIDVVEHDLAIEPSRATRSRRGLDHLCSHYGVKPGGHDALNDARAAVEVFFEQVRFNTAGQMAFGLTAPPASQSLTGEANQL